MPCGRETSWRQRPCWATLLGAFQLHLKSHGADIYVGPMRLLPLAADLMLLRRAHAALGC